MRVSTQTPLLLLIFASAALTACGGGGGGEVLPPAQPYVSWTEAQTTATGLVAPSRIVKGGQEGLHGAVTNVNEVVLEFEHVPKVAASRQLALIYDGATGAIPSAPIPCPGGAGFVSVFESVPAETPRKVMYQYSGCTIGGYTLSGGNTTGSSSALKMDASGLGYTVSHANIAASGPGLVVGDTVDATSTCTLPAAVGQPLVCITVLEGKWQWGKDFTYAAGKVSGTYRSADPDLAASPNMSATHNTTYTDFGPTSGVATVFGTNGYSVLTRTGSLTFGTLTTINGMTYSVNVVCGNISCNP